MAKLLVHESSGIREFELVDNEVKVGRELDNTLRLADPSISRHHAVLRKTLAGHEIEDLGSSNGVLVNGNKVSSAPLKDGDRVTLGQIQVTFVDPKPAAAAPSSPLGTVRINPDEMRRVQGVQEIQLAEPEVPAPPPPAPPRIPAEAQATAAPGRAPVVAAPARPSEASGENSVPGWLQGWVPPIPDDAEPVMVGEVPERGDFVTRLLAYLIDIAPLIGIMVIFMMLNFAIVRIPGLNVVLGCFMSILQTAISLAYSFFYLPWCWSKFGATPGKKLMKLRVVPEDDPHGRIDLGTAYLRLLGHIVNGCLLGLPYLMILGAERKSLQDMISKSICIKVDR